MPKTSVQARAQGSNGNGATAMYDSPAMGTMNPFTFFTINMAGYSEGGVPPWSYYPQVRDMYLRVLAKNEPIMASALYNVTSRIKSLRWNIPKGGRNDKIYYQKLFAESEGGSGYGEFISKVVTDLLTQDNGAFIELVGAGREDRPLVGRVKELWHMDSGQCWRTFDKEFPVIYIDPLDNSYHRMHHSRIMRIASFPQPDERARGIGFCAVSRALKLLQTMRAIQTYRDEKITGKFNRGIIYGNGVTVKQFDEATERAEQVAESLNFTVYKDLPVLLSMMPDMKLSMLDLASLPDGFDYEKELTLYVYCLALAFGTDAREFWPATASGATKADATVQHLKAQGKGTADIIKALESGFGWQVMPSNGKATFEYDNTDDEQDKAVAELHAIKAANIAMYQQNGWIDQFEARAMAINAGLIDPQALLVVTTPEQADDTARVDSEEDINAIERPPAEDAEPGAVDEFEFDPALEGGKAVTVKFEETKHQRASDGKFGSGGGSSDPEKPQIGTSPQGMKFKLTPLADRLKAFLGILNQAGSYKDNQLTIKRSSRNRSADLQTYLRNKGFPNATITAQKVGKGYVYDINPGDGAGAPTKRKRKARKKKVAGEKTLAGLKDYHGAVGRKDIDLQSYIDQYTAALNDLYDDFIDNVTGDPSDLDGALDDLYDEFINSMPVFLTTGFGVGLQGDDPTDTGIDLLETIGQTSADFFSSSFMAALIALGVGGMDSNQISTTLESLRARFLMYVGSMWNAIWAGLFDRTPDTLRVRRVMEQGAHHCDTCPGKEKEYNSFDEMVNKVGLPGDGSDTCLTNCRCTIEVETEPGSGIFGSLAGAPTVFVTPLFEVLRKDSRNGRAA